MEDLVTITIFSVIWKKTCTLDVLDFVYKVVLVIFLLDEAMIKFAT